MNLHFRGIQVPALGSPRDIVYREYLVHEAKIEAKKHELFLLTTLATPTMLDDNGRRTWDAQARDTFDRYIALLLGQEVPPEKKEEKAMLEYYENVVKKSAPVLGKDKEGKLVVHGFKKL